MTDSRAISRLPSAEAHLALAKAYQSAADAPATLRAYAADLKYFREWCDAHGLQSMPAEADTVSAYLVPQISATRCRRFGAAWRPLRGRTISPDFLWTRSTYRSGKPCAGSVVRTASQRKSAAPTTNDIKKLAKVCGDDLAGFRDRAMILICFAGALRRSELVGLDMEHIQKTESGIRLLIPHSKTDGVGEGAEVGIVNGSSPETCPVRALRAWQREAAIGDGPVFRRVTRHGTVGSKRISPEAVWRVLKVRAEAAGLKGTMLELISPHGMRAGFVTTAYRNGVPDEEIMGPRGTAA
jgi:integrase